MKTQFLIAVKDEDYIEHLSKVLMERYSDTFDVHVYSSEERLEGSRGRQKADVILADTALEPFTREISAKQRLLLWERKDAMNPEGNNQPAIYKYQRISSIVSEVLEYYAAARTANGAFSADCGRISVAWSPCGGSGKTTVALAYAAQMVSKGKKAVYLNLERFASTHVYFPAGGKSISRVFDRLDEDVDLLMQSVRQLDSESGIYYFCCPENYEDIQILLESDVVALAQNCGKSADEVVIDLSSICDETTKQLFEVADSILIALDGTPSCTAKWEQFCSQSSVFEQYAGKMTIVANRGARIRDGRVAGSVALPIVQSGDPKVVYKTLSAGYFDK